MKDFLKRWLQKESFQPGFLGFWINPFFFARRDLFREISRLAPEIGGKVLDVGCGVKPYTGLFRCEEYVGLEYDSPENREKKNADAFYEGKTFPFADGSFDSVVCFEVLEHVPDPALFLGEIRRVLKPQGRLLLTMPFMFEQHEVPLDYQRYTEFGLRRLLETQGFEVREYRKTVPGLRVVSQLIACALVKFSFRFRGAGPRVIAQALAAPFVNLFGLVLGPLRGTGDLFLGHVTLSSRIENRSREMT